MSVYTLHCFAESGNAYKAALMLELTGQAWQPVFVDFFNGQTREQSWRDEVNEQGEVPVLVWCFASNAHIFRPSASAARPTLAKMSSAFRCQRKGRGLAL